MEKSKLLFVDKPAGMTSHDVVNRVREITGVRRVGHGGTLDPFATGLLIVAVGREATKKLARLVKLDKEYEATIELGKTSTTGDPEGAISKVVSKPYFAKAPKGLRRVSKLEIRGVLKNFLGKQKQTPPMFSAKKVKGKKLYELARKGHAIPRKPQDIEIKEIKLVNYRWPYLKIRALVSSGTYLRVLAQDIGERLGTGGYLKELRRTKVGRFDVQDALPLDKIAI